MKKSASGKTVTFKIEGDRKEVLLANYVAGK